MSHDKRAAIAREHRPFPFDLGANADLRRRAFAILARPTLRALEIEPAALRIFGDAFIPIAVALANHAITAIFVNIALIA